MSEVALKALGEAIRTRRGEIDGLSQEGLADLAGMHRTYVSEIERGTRDVPMSTLYAIVEGLGLRLAMEFRMRSGSRPNMRLPLPKPAWHNRKQSYREIVIVREGHIE